MLRYVWCTFAVGSAYVPFNSAKVQYSNKTSHLLTKATLSCCIHLLNTGLGRNQLLGSGLLGRSVFRWWSAFCPGFVCCGASCLWYLCPWAVVSVPPVVAVLEPWRWESLRPLPPMRRLWPSVFCPPSVCGAAYYISLKWRIVLDACRCRAPSVRACPCGYCVRWPWSLGADCVPMRILSVSAFYPHVFLRLVFVASLIALSAACGSEKPLYVYEVPDPA